MNDTIFDMKIIAIGDGYFLAEPQPDKLFLYYLVIENLNVAINTTINMIENKNINLSKIIWNCIDKETENAMHKINSRYGREIIYKYEIKNKICEVL